MADGQPLLFYYRRCHVPTCGAPFFICRPCYRGQRYCSPPCREESRRQQRRAANRRHQQSDEGRLDHRDRQRVYRDRRAAGRVTDQGSASISVSGSIARRASIGPGAPVANGAEPVAVRWVPRPAGRSAARGQVCCMVCGRHGELIELFHRRE